MSGNIMAEKMKNNAKKLFLEKVKKGDTLYFRCGGQAKIFSIEPSERYANSVFIRYCEEQCFGAHYCYNGQMREKHKTPFDVIKVRKYKKKAKK